MQAKEISWSHREGDIFAVRQVQDQLVREGADPHRAGEAREDKPGLRHHRPEGLEDEHEAAGEDEGEAEPGERGD